MKSNQNPNKLFLSLVIVIFLAGCTQQFQSSQTGNGVSVLSFKPDFDKINSGSKFSLNLILENTGESQAKDVSAELVGLDGWNIQPSRTQTTNDLSGADTVSNFKGDQTSIEWTLVAPSKEFDQSYQFSSKVYYTYETVASAQFKALSFDYYRTLSSAEQQTEKQGVIDQSYTAGPLKVTITTNQIAPQGGSIPIEIDIENTGGGNVFKGGDRPAPATIDVVSLNVEGVDTCKNLPPTDLDVKLSSGDIAKVQCNLKVSDVSTIKIVPIHVKLDYRYFLEVPSTISVVKNVQSQPM